MYYGDKQKAKVNISYELERRGWNIYGFRGDESDSMTDYYCPAHWWGIAEKNGFVLLVDVYGTGDSGKEIYTQEEGTQIDYEKLSRLQALASDAGATEGEKAAALAGIERLKGKQANGKKLVDRYPVYLNSNPKGSSWHIEKDGQILAKGNGVFACYVGNDHMEPYKSERKAKVNAFCDRIENVLKDADALTAEVVRVPKTVIKAVELDTKEIKPDQLIKDVTHIKMLVSYTHGNNKGNVWQLVRIYNGNNDDAYIFQRLGKRGKPVNGDWYLTVTKINLMLQKGHIAIVEMKEFTEYEEKTVYKKTARKQKQEFNNVLTGDVEEVEGAATVNSDSVTAHASYNINEEKNGIEIKFTEKPSSNIIEGLKENGFRWSSYSGVWWAKQSEQRLKFAKMLVEAYNSIIQEEPETEEEAEETAQETVTAAQEETKQETTEEINKTDKNNENDYGFSVDPAFTYHDVHFKAWNMELEEISEYLTAFNIPYGIAGEKFICIGLTSEQVKIIEEVNALNGAIIFYDNKYNQNPDNSSEKTEELETTSNSEAKEEPQEIFEPVIINGKVAVKRIEFIWSESKYIQDNLTFNTFAEAEKMVRDAAQKMDFDAGYDKTKFLITWTDGNTYEGRLDIEKENALQSNPIKQHIKDWLTFLTGDNKPERMTEAKYIETLGFYNITESEKQEMYDFLKKYALTDLKLDNIINFPKREHQTEINKEEESNNNSMLNNDPVNDDLLSMFDNVEIENNSRIAADDLNYCQEQEKQYKAAITILENTLQAFKEVKSGYIDRYNDIQPLETRITKVKERFINNICWHFEKKYNVTIDENFKSKYNSDVTYNQILDEIFIQLGGFSFEEKASKEIKDNMKQLVTRWGDSTKHMSIKGNKITFDSLYIVSYCSIWQRHEIGYNSRQNAIKLFQALTHFDNGNSDMHYTFSEYYLKDTRSEMLFNKLDLNLNKIKSIKMFKNGRIDIEFTSNEYARKFAREYCGITNVA